MWLVQRGNACPGATGLYRTHAVLSGRWSTAAGPFPLPICKCKIFSYKWQVSSVSAVRMDFCVQHRGEPKGGRWQKNHASKFSCSISWCESEIWSISMTSWLVVLLCWLHTDIIAHSHSSTHALLWWFSTFNNSALIKSLKWHLWTSENDVTWLKHETNGKNICIYLKNLYEVLIGRCL